MTPDERVNLAARLRTIAREMDKLGERLLDDDTEQGEWLGWRLKTLSPDLTHYADNIEAEELAR